MRARSKLSSLFSCGVSTQEKGFVRLSEGTRVEMTFWSKISSLFYKLDHLSAF